MDNISEILVISGSIFSNFLDIEFFNFLFELFSITRPKICHPATVTAYIFRTRGPPHGHNKILFAAILRLLGAMARAT
jgi:hypothetical protein